MKRALIVDNHPVMLKYMQNLLHKQGHQVKTAKDGLEALEILKQNAFDVAFVDLVMPNISGDKLCRIIRSTESSKSMYLVVLSAIAAEEKVDFRAFGADACIAKGPFAHMSRYILDIMGRLDDPSAGDPSPEILGIEDITQREITRELLSSKRHSDAILSNISEGILELTMGGTIIYANTMALTILGSAEERLLGMDFLLLFAASERDQVRRLLESVTVELGVAGTGDASIPIGQRLISMQMVPVTDENSLSVVVILNEVTEQVRAKEALRKSESKYRGLVENMAEVVYTTDTSGRLTYVNPAAESITGLEASEMVGAHLEEIIHPDDWPRVQEMRSRLLTGETLQSEIRIVNGRSNEVRWVRASSRPLEAGGAIAGTQGIASDITDRILLEQRLIRSERLAATGELAANIAHEINSPLQGVTSLLSVISKTHQDDAALLKNIEMLHEAFERIRETVRKLLDLNRPGKGKKQLTDINAVVTDTITLIGMQLRKNKIQVRTDLCAELPSIIASPQQLSQVLLCLINNAVEAMSGHRAMASAEDHSCQKKRQMCLSTQYRDNRVVVRVEDTGPGIPEEGLELIFDPFYSKKKQMGLGVGLSICHGIVSDHNGTITAGNKPGGGAVFEITLPVK